MSKFPFLDSRFHHKTTMKEGESMTVSKFIRKLLNLKDVLVVRFGFRFWDRELQLCVTPLKNGAHCSQCRRRGRIIRSMDHRLWQDVPVCGWSILFHYCPSVIICRQHNRVQKLTPAQMPSPCHLSFRLCDACVLPINASESCRKDPAGS